MSTFLTLTGHASLVPYFDKNGIQIKKNDIVLFNGVEYTATSSVGNSRVKITGPQKSAFAHDLEVIRSTVSQASNQNHGSVAEKVQSTSIRKEADWMMKSRFKGPWMMIKSRFKKAEKEKEKASEAEEQDTYEEAEYIKVLDDFQRLNMLGNSKEHVKHEQQISLATIILHLTGVDFTEVLEPEMMTHMTCKESLSNYFRSQKDSHPSKVYDDSIYQFLTSVIHLSPTFLKQFDCTDDTYFLHMTFDYALDVISDIILQYAERNPRNYDGLMSGGKTPLFNQVTGDRAPFIYNSETRPSNSQMRDICNTFLALNKDAGNTDRDKQQKFYYHGTSLASATSISHDGVILNRSMPLADFGQAFYLHDEFDEAVAWAYKKNPANPAVCVFIQESDWLDNFQPNIQFFPTNRGQWKELVLTYRFRNPVQLPQYVYLQGPIFKNPYDFSFQNHTEDVAIERVVRMYVNRTSDEPVIQLALKQYVVSNTLMLGGLLILPPQVSANDGPLATEGPGPLDDSNFPPLGST